MNEDIRDTLGTILNQANQLAEEGRFDLAELLYQVVISNDHNNQKVYVNYSYVLLAQGKYDAGISLLESYLSSVDAPVVEDIWINLALCKNGVGYIDEAIKCLRIAIDQNPTRDEGYASMARVFQEQGKIDEALGILKAGIQFCVDSSILLNNIGAIYNDVLNQHKLASDYFLKALRISPDDPQLLNNLGTSLVAVGDYESACTFFSRAIAIAPDYIKAYHNMAVAQYHANDHVSAMKTITEAVARFPDHPDRAHFISMKEELSRKI